MTTLTASSPVPKAAPVASACRGMAALFGRIGRAHRQHAARRVLMELSDEHRRDVGLDGINVPSATQLEGEALRILALNMPSDWC